MEILHLTKKFIDDSAFVSYIILSTFLQVQLLHALIIHRAVIRRWEIRVLQKMWNDNAQPDYYDCINVTTVLL